MALAALLAKHPEELRADLQQYYGIDLDRAMAGEHSAYHVAVLACHLPSDSRVCIAEDPDAMWTLDTVMSASILNAIVGAIWGMGDKKTRGKRPRPVGPSYITDRGRHKLPAMVMPIAELERRLAEFEHESKE